MTIQEGAETAKPKKPIYKKWWAITGVAIILVMIIGNLGSGDDGDTAKNENTTNDTELVADEKSTNKNGATEWAKKEFGTFDTIEHSGTGDGVVALPEGLPKEALLTSTHNGTGAFVISGADAEGESVFSSSTIVLGAHSGTEFARLESLGKKAKNFTIQADGDWTFKLAPVHTAEVRTLPTEGTGHSVFLIEGASHTVNITSTDTISATQHTGGAFGLNSLAIEMGAYSGDVLLKKSPSLIEMGTKGDWSITPK